MAVNNLEQLGSHHRLATALRHMNEHLRRSSRLEDFVGIWGNTCSTNPKAIEAISPNEKHSSSVGKIVHRQSPVAWRASDRFVQLTGNGIQRWPARQPVETAKSSHRWALTHPVDPHCLRCTSGRTGPAVATVGGLLEPTVNAAQIVTEHPRQSRRPRQQQLCKGQFLCRRFAIPGHGFFVAPPAPTSAYSRSQIQFRRSQTLLSRLAVPDRRLRFVARSPGLWRTARD